MLPFRERRQAPIFQMVMGREYRMVRSTGTDAPAQDTTSPNADPPSDHNYQMRPTVPVVPFTAATSVERVRSQLSPGVMTSRQMPVVVPRMPQSQPAIGAGQIIIPVSVQSTTGSQTAAQTVENRDVVTTQGEEATVAIVTITASSTPNPPMFVQSSPVLSESAMISAAAETPRPTMTPVLQRVREVRASSRLKRSNAIRCSIIL